MKNKIKLIGNHLYEINDDEKNEGDWIFHISKNSIFQINSNSAYSNTNYISLKYAQKYDWCKKIVASTDTSLVTYCPNQCDGCKANLPLEGNIHKDEQTFGIACSKNRYITKIPPISAKIITDFNKQKNMTKNEFIDKCLSAGKIVDNKFNFPRGVISKIEDILSSNFDDIAKRLIKDLIK